MYFAVWALPPEYPDTTFLTPLTCLNTASTPQKHPPANTAVASPGVAAFGGAPAKSGTAARAAPPSAKITIANSVVERMGISSDVRHLPGTSRRCPEAHWCVFPPETLRRPHWKQVPVYLCGTTVDS